jgi:hypothetical protein
VGHDETRVKVDAVLSEGPSAVGYSYWHDEDASWHYKQALMDHDFRRADTVRLIVEAEIAEDREHWPEHATGTRRVGIVRDALKYRALDQACDELLRWHRDAITSGVEADTGRRADCRQLLEASICFLTHVDAASVDGFESVHEATSELFTRIESVATADNVEGWAKVRRQAR